MDQLITLLIIASPLAYPLPSLPSTAKHVVCLATSAFFFVGILDLQAGFLQLLGTSLITYFLAKLQLGGRKMPWIVFFFEMGHLTIKWVLRACMLLASALLTSLYPFHRAAISSEHLATFR